MTPLPSTKRIYFPLILLTLHLRLRLNEAMNNHGETTRKATGVFGHDMIWKFLFSIDIFSIIREDAHTHIKKRSLSKRSDTAKL